MCRSRSDRLVPSSELRCSSGRENGRECCFLCRENCVHGHSGICKRESCFHPGLELASAIIDNVHSHVLAQGAEVTLILGSVTQMVSASTHSHPARTRLLLALWVELKSTAWLDSAFIGPRKAILKLHQKSHLWTWWLRPVERL